MSSNLLHTSARSWYFPFLKLLFQPVLTMTILVDWINHFSRHLIGVLFNGRISSPEFVCDFPFLYYQALWLSLFEQYSYPEHVSSRALRSHIAWIWVSVVSVMPLINPLFDGRRVPVFVQKPLDSLSAALVIIFIPVTYKMTEMVQSVTIPFSSSIQSVV